LTEEFGLKVFGNKELRKIFGPVSDEVKEGSVETVHREPSLITKYCSSDKTKKNEMGRKCSPHDE
jgi:hypothetical protein